MAATMAGDRARPGPGSARAGAPPELAVRLVSALLALGVASVHVADQGGITAFNSPDWMGWAFRVIEAAGVLTALVLLLPWSAWVGWAAGVLLGTGPFLGYVASRSVGVPGDHADIGDRKLYGVGAFAQAGWPEFPPSHPKRLAEAIPAALDPKERLAYMNTVGVYYQVMYPNILGFHSHVFLNEMPRELATECVRAYNDWLTEFCSADSRRLIPMMMLPFWDIDESVAEMKRAYEMGHKGVLFAARYNKVGLPRRVDDYWEPLLGQAQEMGLPMNFHVGFLSSPGGSSRSRTARRLHRLPGPEGCGCIRYGAAAPYR